MKHLDASTISQRQTLDDLAGRLHFQDTELLGRLLQLPTTKPAASNNAADGFDLWAVDRLNEVL